MVSCCRLVYFIFCKSNYQFKWEIVLILQFSSEFVSQSCVLLFDLPSRLPLSGDHCRTPAVSCCLVFHFVSFTIVKSSTQIDWNCVEKQNVWLSRNVSSGILSSNDTIKCQEKMYNKTQKRNKMKKRRRNDTKMCRITCCKSKIYSMYGGER